QEPRVVHGLRAIRQPGDRRRHLCGYWLGRLGGGPHRRRHHRVLHGERGRMTAVSRGRQSRDWDRFDYLLVLAALALVVLGLLLIYSGSLRDYEGSLLSFSSPVARQAVFALIAVGAMLVVARVDYHHLTHYALAIYV